MSLFRIDGNPADRSEWDDDELAIPNIKDVNVVVAYPVLAVVVDHHWISAAVREAIERLAIADQGPMMVLHLDSVRRR